MKSLRTAFLGELVGTFILTFFGCGVVAAAVTTGAQSGVFQVAIVWGLEADLLDVEDDVEVLVKKVEQRLLATGRVRDKDHIAIVFGAPVGELGRTNTVRLHQIGDLRVSLPPPPR